MAHCSFLLFACLRWFCVSDFHHFPKSEQTSDLGFRTYYQFAKFTHEQLSEIYKPEDIKSTADWADLHLLRPEKFEMKELETFLTASGVRRAFQKCRLSDIQANCCLKAMQTFFKYFVLSCLTIRPVTVPLRGGFCVSTLKSSKTNPIRLENLRTILWLIQWSGSTGLNSLRLR